MVERHGAEPTPFLGAPRPVDLVARLLSHEVDGARVVLRCGTDRHHPELADYYGTVAETELTPPSPGADATVVLEMWAPETWRVRYSPGDTVPDTPVPPIVGGPDALSPMVVGRPATGLAPEVVEDDRAVHLRGPATTLTVVREPWRLELRDRVGTLLWATTPVDVDGLARPDRQWNPPEQRWLFLHRYAYPLGSTVDGPAGGSSTAFASFALRHDEHVVGFGESFGRLDKVGTTQTLWPQEAFGNASPATYKPVPFWLSDRGHGVFVHTANRVRVDVGSREHSAVSVVVDDTAALDLFVLAGPPAGVVSAYNRLTGPPALPPRWSFGFWLGRISYSAQEEVEAVAREVRERRIPCDVIHVDTGWFTRDYVCDLRFSPERFPDPAAMTRRLRDAGLRVCLWQWPNYNVASPLFDEATAAGYLARRPSGHTYTFAGGYGDDAGVLDVSDPDAVAWYRGKLADLFALGVAAIKVDYGDGAPPAARYAGVESAAARNLYPVLYQDAVWGATEAAFPGEAVIWARAGWAGSQRYPVHWSGDGVARFEDLACVLRAMLSIGVSGFAFYSHDVGGFSGLPDEELWVRWLQLGVFSSHVRAHGTPPREPWAFGPRAEELSRRFLELRYRLLPHLWSESRDAVAAGLPLVRPLLLADPDDPVAWQVDDQFLLGRHLLVAPVLEQGATRRRVYLPAGRWFDWWSGRCLDGGRFVTVDAPLDVVPLFVAEGAMIPLGPVQQHVDETPCDPLTLHLYGPNADGDAAVVVGDGPPVAVRWTVRGERVAVAVEGAPGVVEVVVHAPGGSATSGRARDGRVELPIGGGPSS